MPITSRYPPEAFAAVPMSQLSQHHFEIHPIWSEYYDCNERAEIIAWGVDPQELAAIFRELGAGNDHFAYTVLCPHPLPARMRIYIKADFTTLPGRKLQGYVMNADAFVIGLFASGEEFMFSKHPALADAFTKELARLRSALSNPKEAIFPLRYTTDFLNDHEELIVGEFQAPLAAD